AVVALSGTANTATDLGQNWNISTLNIANSNYTVAGVGRSLKLTNFWRSNFAGNALNLGANLSASLTMDSLILGNSSASNNTMGWLLNAGSSLTVSSRITEVVPPGALNRFLLEKRGTGSLTLTGGTATTPSQILRYRQLDGGSTTLNGGSLFVNGSEQGAMTIQNGTFTLQNGAVFRANGGVNIANGVGTSATLTLDDATSSWTSGTLSVGERGTGTFNLTNGASISATSVLVGNGTGGSGAVTVSGAGTIIRDAQIYVGGFSGATGALLVEKGGRIDGSYLLVSSNATSVPRPTATFDDATINIGGDIVVEGGNAGIVTARNGAQVRGVGLQIDGFEPGGGSVTITGATTRWSTSNNFNADSVLVGKFRHGTLTVSDGAVLTTNGSARIAGGAGFTGTVLLTGPGSKWEMNGLLTIGAGGNAVMNVADGATLKSSHASLDRGTVSITGANTSWTLSTGSFLPDNAAELSVGVFANGTLTIADGATVSAGAVKIGNAQGKIIADGAIMNTTGLADGVNFATNTSRILEIRSGGLRINQRGDSVFSGVVTGNGALTKAGVGSLTLSGVQSRTGATDIEGGTLAFGQSSASTAYTVFSGATLNFGGFAPVAGATIVNNGTIIGLPGGGLQIGPGGSAGGSGSFGGGLTNGGAVSPGNSPGTLTIQGDYTQTATGALNIEIGGTGLSEFDQLLVTGNATLDGFLNISFVGGYEPLSGGVWDFMRIGGDLSGFFDPMNISISGFNLEQRGLAAQVQARQNGSAPGYVYSLAVVTVVPEEGAGWLVLLAAPVAGTL
ncbi:MAG: hypothetical protein H8F28_23435, partial [Fibrella sp.]|nr:hypothetical protein [Armatimonadota bacterium]